MDPFTGFYALQWTKGKESRLKSSHVDSVPNCVFPDMFATKQQNLWKAALEAAFTFSGMVLKQQLGEWTGPPNQVWRKFDKPGTK
jgi:hypothetical protein